MMFMTKTRMMTIPCSSCILILQLKAFPDIVRLANKSHMMDPATLRARLQNKGAISNQSYEEMDLTELGNQKQPVGKHQGQTFKTIVETEEKYVLWLLDHQSQNVKYQPLLIYARRLEEEKAKKEGVQFEKTKGYAEVPKDTMFPDKFAGSLTNTSTGSDPVVTNPQQKTIQDSLHMICEELAQIKIQLNHQVQHSQQIQQAVMILQAQSQKQQEDMNVLYNRMTQMELQIEDLPLMVEPPVRQG